MRKPIRTILASTIMILISQQAMAENPPIPDLQIKAPPPPAAWNAQQPIFWADCIPVPNDMTNNMISVPATQVPQMYPTDTSMPVAPTGPFFNTPAPPTYFDVPQQAVAPAAPQKCDDSAKDELVKLQDHYDKAAAASKAKILSMTQSLSDTENQLADSRLIIEELSKSKDDTSKQIADFEGQIKALDDEKAKLMADSKASLEASTTLKSKIESLEVNAGSELEELKTKLAAETEIKAGLEAKLAELDASNKTLQAKLTELEEGNKALSTKLAEAEDANKSLQTKLGSLEASAGDQARKLTALGQSATELTALKSAYKERNDETAKLKEQLAELDGTNKSLQTKLGSLEASAGDQARKLNALGQSATELTALKSAYKERNDETAKLKEQLTEFDISNKTLLEKLAGLEANSGEQAKKLSLLGQSATELTELQAAYKEKSEESDVLKAKIEMLDSSNKILISKLEGLDELQGTLEAKSEEGDISKARIEMLDSSNKILISKLEGLEASAGDESSQLKAQLAELDDANKSLTEKVATIEAGAGDESNKLKAQLAELDDANKSLTAKLGTMEASAGDQARKLTALGQSASELTALQSAYRMRNDENVELKAKLAELESSITAMEASAGEQSQKLSLLGQSATELTALQAAYRTLNDANGSLNGRIAELETNLAERAGDVDVCNTEIIDLKSKLAGLDSEKQKTMAALDKNSKEMDALKASCKALGVEKDELASKLAIATADGDKDGVYDNADKCLASPSGSKVNAEGCPAIKDADSDGVADASDLCPTSASGSKVNEFGCEPSENIALDGVNFLTGSSSLTSESLPILDAAAVTIQKYPKIELEISGHTDNQGKSNVNKRLSQRRANSVMIHLIKKGVDAGKLIAKGYGDQNPVADNATEEGRKANRRVELKIR